MEAYICETCGVQYAPGTEPPAQCIICEDERQYVGWGGQQWTTLPEMRAAGYTNDVRDVEPGLSGIGVQPHFGIGQRALLVQTPAGNVLWDCVGYIDDDAIEAVRVLGGIHAIALSHPHFYGCAVEWSRAFDAAIYVPSADRQWFVRPHETVRFWQDRVELLPGVTLVQCGGHFPGSAVIHWAAGAQGRGVLLTSDSIQVVQDRRYVTFMWSYPNVIPLSAAEVRGVVESVLPYPFDRIYGGWWHTVVSENAREAVERSAERYIRHIQS